MIETIEERILKVGAKLIDEMLLHNTAIESNIDRNSFGCPAIYIGAHHLVAFRRDELKKLKYLSQRINLPEDGKKQLDKIWALEQEIKRVAKINKTIDEVVAYRISVKEASKELGISKRQVSKLVKWNRELKDNDQN